MGVRSSISRWVAKCVQAAARAACSRSPSRANRARDQARTIPSLAVRASAAAAPAR